MKKVLGQIKGVTQQTGDGSYFAELLAAVYRQRNRVRL